MNTNDILKLVEVAKNKGLDEITVEEKLDENTVCELQQEHNFAVYFKSRKGYSILDDEGTITIITWNEEAVNISRWAESLGSTRHYQVIYYDDDKWPYYGLHEVVPKKDGSIGTWTACPFTTGESVEEIKKTLQLMLNDVSKYEPLKYNEIKDND